MVLKFIIIKNFFNTSHSNKIHMIHKKKVRKIHNFHQFILSHFAKFTYFFENSDNRLQKQLPLNVEFSNIKIRYE